MTLFTFTSKPHPVITDFARIEKKVLEDIAFNAPGLEWDEKEEIIKTGSLFKEASEEIQTQAVSFRVELIIREQYIRSLERASRMVS